MRTFTWLLTALLACGCANEASKTAEVPKGKETVTAGGGTRGITEDQIELGPSLQNAENRAGSKISGN